MNIEDGLEKSPTPRAYEYKSLQRQDLPCWYEMSGEDTNSSIFLKIHNDFINKNKGINENAPLVLSLKEEFGFKTFSSDFSKDIGYEESFKLLGEDEGFMHYELQIPKVKTVIEHGCFRCDGTGEDNTFGNEECIFCGGSGDGYDLNWHPAKAASASLTILTSYLKYSRHDTSATKPQLFTVETVTGSDLHGGSIGGEISPIFRSWLRSKAGFNSIPTALDTMRNVHERMLGLSRFNYSDFRMRITEDGGLMMDCPGNACGIHPDTYRSDLNRGYEINCHNVDTSVQQLTLISGLAYLHDLARKELG